MANKISEAFKIGTTMSADELTTFYSDWASAGDYDKTLSGSGYVGPKVVAGYLSKLEADKKLTKKARILDVGSGTGLVGEELSRHGFTNVWALDPSQDSIDVSMKRGCYKDYLKCLVGPEEIPVASDTFDGAVSSGVFLPGHCDGTSLKEVVRVVKAGGRIVIATRRIFFDDHYDNYNFRQVSDELVASKTCSLAQEDIHNYLEQQMGVLLIFTVC